MNIDFFFYCPYCGRKIIHGNNFTPDSCLSHPVRVEFSFEDYDYGKYIAIYNSSHSYIIYIWINFQYMSLYEFDSNSGGYIDLALDLDIDPNLTPENIDQKIKTYLNFQ